MGGGAQFGQVTYMGVGQFQYPPCKSLHFWKPVFNMPAHPEKRCFLERRASPSSKIHHFFPPPDMYMGPFLFFMKKIVLGPVFLYKSQTLIPKFVYEKQDKIGPKTRFFRKKRKWSYVHIGSWAKVVYFGRRRRSPF